MASVEFNIAGLGSSTPVAIADASGDLADAIDVAWGRCLTTDQPDLVSETVHAQLTDKGGPAPEGVVWSSTVGGIMQNLTQQITYAKIRVQAGSLLMFHAGALAHPETGDTLAFVAPGGTGKTTLMRTLGRRFGYLTDETVGVMPADRTVLPYP